MAGGPRPRVNERRVGDGASGSGVATGISPNPASRRPLGQAALARRSAPIRPSSGERALDGYVLLVVRAIAPFASGDDLVDVSSAQSRIAPSGSRSVTRAGVSSYSPGRDLGVGAADDEAVN